MLFYRYLHAHSLFYHTYCEDCLPYDLDAGAITWTHEGVICEACGTVSPSMGDVWQVEKEGATLEIGAV